MFVLATARRWVTLDAYALARHTVPRYAVTTEHMKLSNKSVTKQNRATRRGRPSDPFALPKLNAVAVDAHRRLSKITFFCLRALYHTQLVHQRSPPQ